MRHRSPALPSSLALLAVTLAFGATAHSATVSGRVRLEGAAPPRPTIRMSADPVCDRAHPSGTPTESAIVAPDGAVAGVVVHLGGRLPKKYQAPPPGPSVLLDIVGCRFVPHVLALRVGQELEIRNSDATAHDVRGMRTADEEVRYELPAQGVVVRRTLTLPGVGVELTSSRHPWMSAWLSAFEHPFFAVTGPDGSFRITGLPEGKYTLEAWHESLGRTSVPVEVGDEDDDLDVGLSFAGN